jgi:23S rRNA pseudouridine1911/1915/1917 synthase
VRGRFPLRSWNEVRSWIRGGNVFIDDARVVDPTALVTSGALLEVCSRPSQRKKASSKQTSSESFTASAKAAERLRSQLLVYVDSQLVVVEKPAGISTVPYDETEPRAAAGGASN